MPWTAADAEDHIHGLTPHQRVIWARVATRALAACRADGGSLEACEGRAIRQANAVARRAPTKAIKAIGDGALDILAIPLSGPFEGGTDADGETFTESTDLCLSWFGATRPLLYEHGLDDDLKVEPIGTVDSTSVTKDAAGWWVRAQLDKSGRYWRQIMNLIDQELLFASSAAMPHLVKRAPSGEILRWPWVELSLTPNPSNIFAIVQPAAAKGHYLAAGLTPPPTLDPDDGTTFNDRLDRLTDEVSDAVALAVRLTDGRLKVGRAISAARRQRLAALMAELAALLDETAPPEPEDADDATPAKATAAPAAPDLTLPASLLLPLYDDFKRLDTLHGVRVGRTS